FENRRIDRARRWVPQLQSIQYPNDGQTEILAVSLADRECSSEVDAKGLSSFPIEDRHGAVVAAQKSAAAGRENAHAELIPGLDTENVEIEKALARHDVAKQRLPGKNVTACGIEFLGINQWLINGQCQRLQIAASRGLEHGPVKPALHLHNIRPIPPLGARHGVPGSLNDHYPRSHQR